MGKNSDPVSGIPKKHPGSYFQEFSNNYFGLKCLNYLLADPGSGAFLNRDPGRKNEDTGPGINIPDPQHCICFTPSL